MNDSSYRNGSLFRSEPIEAYLSGTMPETERAKFELAMFEDPDLAEAVDSERLLRMAIHERYAGEGP